MKGTRRLCAELFGIIHLNVARNQGKVGVVPVHAMKAYRWCGGTAAVLLKLCTRCEVSDQLHVPAVLSLGKGGPGPIR